MAFRRDRQSSKPDRHAVDHFVMAAEAAFEADSMALDAAVAALIAAPVAADAALAAAVLSAGGVTTTVDEVDDGVVGDGVVVVTDGVAGDTTVVSSFLLQAAKAMAATSTASESDLFILSILRF